MDTKLNKQILKEYILMTLQEVGVIPIPQDFQDRKDKMDLLFKQIMKAYRAGDYELAEDLEAEHEVLAANLEADISGWDEWEGEIEGGVEDFGIEHRDGPDMEREMAAAYSNFLTSSAGMYDEEMFLERLRGIVDAYQWSLGGKLDPSITDQDLVEMAKEFYEASVAKKDRYANRGKEDPIQKVKSFLRKSRVPR